MSSAFDVPSFECSNCVIENFTAEENDVVFSLSVPPYSSAKLRFICVEDMTAGIEIIHQKIFCIRSRRLDNEKIEYEIQFCDSNVDEVHIIAKSKRYSE
jgi:hypothetical protein